MDRDAIITTVLSRLGRQEGNSYLVGRAQAELQLIQEQLEEGVQMFWFLVSDEIDTATTADTRVVDLPANWLMEHEDYPVYRYDSTAEDPYIELTKDDYDLLDERFGGTEATIPTHYCIVGEQAAFFPTPDAAYPLKLRYYAKQATLDDSTSENAWTEHASDLLIAKLGVIMSGYKRDPYWSAKFPQDEIAAMNRLITFDEARKQARKAGYRGDV